MQQLDRIQNFQTPLDTSEVIQVLPHPIEFDQFITVKLVKRNVKLYDPSDDTPARTVDFDTNFTSREVA